MATHQVGNRERMLDREDFCRKVSEAINDWDKQALISLVEEAKESGVSPIEIVNEILFPRLLAACKAQQTFDLSFPGDVDHKGFVDKVLQAHFKQERDYCLNYGIRDFLCNFICLAFKCINNARVEDTFQPFSLLLICKDNPRKHFPVKMTIPVNYVFTKKLDNCPKTGHSRFDNISCNNIKINNVRAPVREKIGHGCDHLVQSCRYIHRYSIETIWGQPIQNLYSSGFRH